MGEQRSGRTEPLVLVGAVPVPRCVWIAPTLTNDMLPRSRQAPFRSQICSFNSDSLPPQHHPSSSSLFNSEPHHPALTGMTLRNASGKFALPSFGRSKNQANHESTPAQSRVSSSTYNSGPAPTMTSGDSEPSSPRFAESTRSGSTGGGGMAMGGGGGGGGGGGPSAFDGIGRKLGKSIAHTSLLPSLGNQDLRALQE